MKESTNSVEEKILGQGVFSAIQFPLDADQVAVSRAISELLSEGWVLDAIEDKHITLRRKWEV